VCAAGIGALFGTAHAATVVVKKGGDLQAAIDGAANGDTIIVKAGKYGPVSLTGRTDLTIKGRGKVILDGTAAENCLLFADCQRVTVTGLTLKDSQGSALLATGCEELTVRGCTVLNAGDEGMEFSSCFKVLADKNTIDKTGDDGIALSDSSGAPSRVSVVSKNKIRNVPDGGIDVNGNDNVVTGNQIRDSKVNGVLVQSGLRNTVEKNKIMTIVGLGIEVLGDVGIVRSNVVLKPTGDGIDVGGDSNVVTKNVVTKSGAVGVRVTGGSNEITKNVIKKSATFDLEDASGGATNTYTANKAKTLDPADLPNPKK
jgi:hypothetical protein